METPQIQWYPGHIAKLERELQSLLKLLDVMIEVRDARIPISSGYNKIAERVRSQRPTLLILNKNDLADPVWTQRWMGYFKDYYPAVLSFDSTQPKGRERIIDTLIQLGEEKMRSLEAKGLKRRPVRVGVVGMPNVGKSSLINTLIGKKKTKTGHRAGVTRTTQWVRIHPKVELLDTPGLIPPKLESQESAKRLASVYSIGDAAFEEELILPAFLENVDALYPGLLKERFDLPEEAELTPESIARRRGYLLSGGEIDYRRTAQAVFKDFRHGKLGGLTLERPEIVQ